MRYISQTYGANNIFQIEKYIKPRNTWCYEGFRGFALKCAGH